MPFPALPGLPGSSTDLFLRAVPNHPGRFDERLLIASPADIRLHPIWRTGHLQQRNEAESGSLALRLTGLLPGFHQPDCSDSLRFRYMYERAIYMVNSFQFTRSARLGLVYQINEDKHSCVLLTRVYLRLSAARFSLPSILPHGRYSRAPGGVAGFPAAANLAERDEQQTATQEDQCGGFRRSGDHEALLGGAGAARSPRVPYIDAAQE